MKKIIPIVSLFLLAFTYPNPKVRIFMIGDSTMANKKLNDFPETGWGQVFHEVFTNEVEIHNYAVNGRSSKSFRNEGLWKKVIDQIQKGDYVFIQFGHNDQKISDTSKYTLPRLDYKTNLQRYIDETKLKGGIPVLLTPVMRRKFNEDGRFEDQHGDYPIVVRELALKNKIDLIDMHRLSRRVIEEHGIESSKDIFMNFTGGIYPKFKEPKEDNTHFSLYGARIMASLVANEIQQQGMNLKNRLKKSGYPNILEFQLPKINQPSFKKDTFNILKYLAKSDGITVNTKAINQAIESAFDNGGGTVLVPSGLWITGPIVLKSNVNLHLSEGTLLQFSDNKDDYPVVETTWEGKAAFRCQAPIWGLNLTNIAITGKGTMDGAGQVWKHVKKSKLTETQWKTLINSGGVLNDKKDTWYPSETSKYGNENSNWTNQKTEGKTIDDYKKIRDFLRPNMVSLTNCKNILIEGVTFLNSPAWTLHPLMCSHITLRNVNVKNPWFGQNNDALDLESCNNALVEGCTFDTGDDAICIKSGKDQEGRLRAKPSKDIIIRNNTVFHGHGGFVIGSEMSGGVNNIFVNNCNFLGTDIGLRFKTKRDRGGVVENIFISDINMNNIPGEAILFDMYYEAKDPVALVGEENKLPIIKAEPLNEGTPSFRSFFLENIKCNGAETAIMLRGLPELNIKNISIKNSNFSSNKGLICIEAENISLENVGLFTIDKTVLQIQNSKNVSFDALDYKKKNKIFLELNGENSANVSFKNTSIENINSAFVFKSGADKKSVIFNK